MSRERLSAIAHHDLAFAAPWSEPTAAAIVTALDLPPGSRVVDLGCGWAELLARVVTAYDAVGEGVERSAAAVERARRSTLERAGGRLTIHAADIRDVDLAPAAYDLVVCVGSTHLFDGYRGALLAGRRLLRPGGRMLVGDGIWSAPPTPAALAGLGAEPDDLLTEPQAREVERDVGLVEDRRWVSSIQEWDAYEDAWSGSLERWAAANRDDPDAAAAVTLAGEHRRGYRDGYRGVLGFRTALLSLAG